MTAVLFTCAGMRVDIVTAFKRAGATTIAVDASRYAPALYHADAYELVPPKDDPAYVVALADAVARHGADLVVPLTDIDQGIVSARRDELGAPVLLPDDETVRTTADKYLAYQALERIGVASPPTWLPADVPPEPGWPVLVKARVGYGGRHIYRAYDRAELDVHLARTPVDSMVQAVCRGEEYSIDVFCDFEGRCLNAIPRTMIESKGGESIKGMTLADRDLVALAVQVAEGLPLRGPATVQCFREPDGSLQVTDINPRFGGAFPLPLAAGGKYPELAVALANGERPDPRVGAYRAGIVMTRYLAHVCLVEGESGLEPLPEALPHLA